MSDFYSVITNIGNKKIAAALEAGTAINLTKFIVGDGGGEEVIPLPSQTELTNKVWESDISSFTRKENLLTATAEIPAEIGGFTVREMGLLDDNGDLFAVANVPPTEKIAGNNVLNTLELTIQFKVENSDVINFTVINVDSNYGVCHDSGNEQNKTAPCDNFSLSVGEIVFVKFENTNTAASPTLNVNDTGAKPIYYENKPIAANKLIGNHTYGFAFDGQNYDFIGDIISVASGTTAGLMSAEDKKKLDGIAEGATKTAKGKTNGSITINGAETIVYTHPAGDGNLHVPKTGTTNADRVLTAGSTAGALSWGHSVKSDVPENAKFTDTVYTHPESSAGAKDSGMYKITTDEKGHITAATPVTKDDITALGISGGEEKGYEHPKSPAGTKALGLYKFATNDEGHITEAEEMTDATGEEHGLMSAKDKKKLDEITDFSAVTSGLRELAEEAVFQRYTRASTSASKIYVRDTGDGYDCDFYTGTIGEFIEVDSAWVSENGKIDDIRIRHDKLNITRKDLDGLTQYVKYSTSGYKRNFRVTINIPYGRGIFYVRDTTNNEGGSALGGGYGQSLKMLSVSDYHKHYKSGEKFSTKYLLLFAPNSGYGELGYLNESVDDPQIESLSWSEVSAIANKSDDERWRYIGKEKSANIDGTEVSFVICGFLNYDVDADNVGVVIAVKDLYGEAKTMNEMEEYLNSVYTAMPEDLKSVIKDKKLRLFTRNELLMTIDASEFLPYFYADDKTQRGAAFWTSDTDENGNYYAIDETGQAVAASPSEAKGVLFGFTI